MFIYADHEDRVRRVMNRNRLDERAAAHRIKHMDRMRKQFFDFYSDTQWGMPESYNIMLSSSALGMDICVNTIIKCLKEMEGRENE